MTNNIKAIYINRSHPIRGNGLIATQEREKVVSKIITELIQENIPYGYKLKSLEKFSLSIGAYNIDVEFVMICEEVEFDKISEETKEIKARVIRQERNLDENN